MVNATVDELNLINSPEGWSVSASAVTDSPMIIISVSDPIPERAAWIESTVAAKFVNSVVQHRIELSSVFRHALTNQIVDIQTRLDAMRSACYRSALFASWAWCSISATGGTRTAIGGYYGADAHAAAAGKASREAKNVDQVATSAPTF